MKGIPKILLDRLSTVDGFDEDAFIASHKTKPITSIRLHPLKNNPHTMTMSDDVVSWCDSGRYLEERPVFTVDPSFHAGAYYVQEASSMFLHHMLSQLLTDKNNLRVLDLCAAPGGKSTLIASLLGRDSLLISNEVIRSRASILEENMTRWGYMNTWVTCNDPKDFTKLNGYFDVIVVDAPCSGSGLFRKDENAIDEWSVSNVDLCVERQKRILANVWSALKQDGILIYSTCSYSKAEDEDMLNWMNEQFLLEGLRVNLDSSWGIVETTASKESLKGYRFFPDKVKGEGFYISAVRKVQSEGSIKQKAPKSQHDKSMYEQSSHLLNIKDFSCIPLNDTFVGINPNHEFDLNVLNKTLYLRKVGIVLGSYIKKSWVPIHDVALSVDCATSLNRIAVNKEQALKYLKREDFGVLQSDKGWYLVEYESNILGWVKCLGNRVNNYLPKYWRIRMSIDEVDWA